MQTASPRESIDNLIAEKQYSKALPLLMKICREQPRNVEKRQQLAEVFTAVGDKRKAFRVFEELVNDFARAGQFARAIAMVKRMQNIEPGRHDLAMKLAILVKNQNLQSQSQAPPRTQPKPTVDPKLPSQPSPPVDPNPGIPPSTPKVSSGPDSGMVRINDLLMQSSVEERLLLDPSEESHSKDFLRGSKLLQDFSAEELEALIGGLQPTLMKPGEIIVAEGQPGSSLFLIASGTVRVYVRNKKKAQKQVRVMHQGDFFGEISLLKSKKRTATITAATPTELLELDRSAVEAIAARHPSVWKIIEDFCSQRKDSVEELGARSRS